MRKHYYHLIVNNKIIIETDMLITHTCVQKHICMETRAHRFNCKCLFLFPRVYEPNCYVVCAKHIESRRISMQIGRRGKKIGGGGFEWMAFSNVVILV